MEQRVIEKMKAKGFEPVKGVAVLNDIVATTVTNPQPGIMSAKLTTQESVDCFNREFSSDWTVFRAIKH